MFCHSCGTQVANDLQFCPNCGQPLSTPAGTGAASVPVWAPASAVQAQTGRWIGAGWEMVKADMGNYALVALIVLALNSVVPIIIQGPLLAGMHIYCMKRMMNRRAEFADVFKGFNFFLPTLVASLVIALFCFGGTLLCIIPGLVLAAMYKFTYLFIFDKRMDFWPAMQSSHNIVKHDYFGYTIFLFALAGVNLLGFLCCVVGVLVSFPVSMAAITVAYKEIVGFDQRTVDTLG
jgi:uncharacterized membrane protein